MASTENAQARDPVGISSAERMAMSRLSMPLKPRATVWLMPRPSMLGASAPVAVSRQPIEAVSVTRRRRPMRSASTESTSTITIDARTAASSRDWSPVEAPNSSAANAAVWVITVPR